MQENQREREFDKYRGDLNPNFRAGQQYDGDHYDTIPAAEVKAIHDRYPDWDDELLESIPVMVVGSRLEEGATYFDLAKPEAGEWTGMNNITVADGEWIVPKSDVEYDVWSLITGVTDPQRLGRFGQAA